MQNTADVKAEAEAAAKRLVEIGGLLPGLEAQLQGQKAAAQNSAHNSTALHELESKIAALQTYALKWISVALASLAILAQQHNLSK